MLASRNPAIGLVLLLVSALAVSGCATDQSRAKSRDAARINTQLGISYAQRGKFDLAEEKLKRALHEDDSLPAAHAAIAVVYQSLGENAKAEKHYRRALALDDRDPTLKNNFGTFLCKQNRANEAEPYFVDAARDSHYGTPEAAWTNAGLCFKTQDPKKAESYLREALKVKPDYREALAILAELSFRQRDFMRTRAFLERYDLSKSATPTMLYMAVITEKALGDTAAARVYEARLKDEFPESEEASSPNLSP